MGHIEPTSDPISISVLGFKEGHEWCALALELDLRGYGNSPDEAFADLREQITMQVTFCQQKGILDSMFHPAEDHYWEMYRQGKRSLMLSLVSHHYQVAPDHHIARDFPFPDKFLGHGRGLRFEPAHA